MEGIALGQIVHSRAGRDKKKYFIVVGIVDDSYVLIADGDLRKITRPKKKKIMHLVIHDMIAMDIMDKIKNNQKILDADLKKSLQSLGLFE